MEFNLANKNDLIALNMEIRSLIHRYSYSKDMGLFRYARKVGISWIEILAIQIGIIMIDNINLEDLCKLLRFHGIGAVIRVN